MFIGDEHEGTSMTSLRRMTEEVVEVNKEKGWYEDDRTFGEEIALLHTEVSEAYEAWRDYGFESVTLESHNDPYEPEKPVDVASELADILIRLLDTCARHDIDLAVEYERKMRYNRARPYRHGGKRL